LNNLEINMLNDRLGVHIQITGIIQGVGFRPFVYNLARRLNVLGWIRNTSSGVEIQVDGSPANLAQFIESLKSEAPPLARIDQIQVKNRPPDGFAQFEILHSEAIPGGFIPVSPDVGLCEDCLRELYDPEDRRYRYPFINCTNCGPRFTIIQDVPYDRPFTTMAHFPMCPECEQEYNDPMDRRFHAQPVACPACGPQIWLEVGPQVLCRQEDAIELSRRMIKNGKILAIKGLGGFHLACDATNFEAVDALRWRKLRVDKPFALMMQDIATVRAYCQISVFEEMLLNSPARPIVLLKRKSPDDLTGSRPIAPDVAPGHSSLGVMLPYTPLHYLLLEPAPGCSPVFVMTSGNLSEEPIVYSNGEARERLEDLADAFLLHDREIQTRCDDSVVRSIQDQNYPVRRARGYAPNPILLSTDATSILAAGGELKNTFCLTRDRYAFLSHHIGELENYETMQAYETAIDHYERLFRIEPKAIAYDLHPDYLATRYAVERAARDNLPAFGFQHHHAHIAACLADNGLPIQKPVIGVAFDGTGYGLDGAIWGGEFLVSEGVRLERAFHLAYIPMPGGDVAVREPWRIGLAWLEQLGLPWSEELQPVRAVDNGYRSLLQQQLRAKINTPLTSSMGRLFDAAASLAGVRQEINYEAQAAIEFEAYVDPDEETAYPIQIQEPQLDPSPMFEALVRDVIRGEAIETISARFHNGVVKMVLSVCKALRKRTGITAIALSGGVWQNMVLLRKTTAALEADGFTVYVHKQVPANDGGLALGQAVLAIHTLTTSD
jgi:hydrogenase maturation protein HypF